MKIDKIYFDLDGVFSDFMKGVEEVCGFRPSENQDDAPEVEEVMWTGIRDADHFYKNLSPIEGSIEMFRKIWKQYPGKCEILTGIPKPRRGIPTAAEDKAAWVHHYLSEEIPVNAVYRVEKLEFSKEGTLLIDDYRSTVDEWEARGGKGIHFKNAAETLDELRKLGILEKQDRGMKIAAFYENILTACEEKNVGLKEYLGILKELGLEQVYISGDSYEKDHEMLTPLLKELGLTYAGFHQHFDFSHNPDDESPKKYIDMVKESGASNILLVPGLIPEGEEAKEEEIRENMKSAIEKAIAYAKPLGIDICMEDFDDPHSPINCVAGMDWFFDRMPDLKCAYDSGNFCYLSEDEIDAFRHYADKLVIMHVKDRAEEPFSELDHPFMCKDGTKAYSVPVGTGKMRIPQIVKELAERGYEGTLIAELYGCHAAYDGLQISVRNLKEITCLPLEECRRS